MYHFYRNEPMRPAYSPLSVTLHPQCREKVTAAASAAVTSTPLVQPGQVEGLQRDTCGGGEINYILYSVVANL